MVNVSVLAQLSMQRFTASCITSYTGYIHTEMNIVSCIVCASQFLESYKSVTLASMAAAFDVSPEFMDTEVRSHMRLWTCLIEL